jgi:Mrp family chromosome partitioning ATPase
VLSAGRTPLDPFSIAVGLQGLAAVLERLRAAADYVIVDAPPITAAADASTVAAATDGVILVVNRRRARRSVLSAVHDQLLHAHAEVLGVVLNRDASQVFGAVYGRRRAPEQAVPDVMARQP